MVAGKRCRRIGFSVAPTVTAITTQGEAVTFNKLGTININGDLIYTAVDAEDNLLGILAIAASPAGEIADQSQVMFLGVNGVHSEIVFGNDKFIIIGYGQSFYTNAAYTEHLNPQLIPWLMSYLNKSYTELFSYLMVNDRNSGLVKNMTSLSCNDNNALLLTNSANRTVILLNANSSSAPALNCQQTAYDVTNKGSYTYAAVCNIDSDNFAHLQNGFIALALGVREEMLHLG